MRHLLLTLFLLLSTGNLVSQNFTGTVLNKYGEPVSGVTVYIKEINQGLLGNEDGVFQAVLAPGKYSVEYKCLGYKSLEHKIVIHNEGIVVERVFLEENPFSLNEVTVTTSEDPAYGIMRKAINKAPLYAASVKEYNADVYIKGNLELFKISGFLDKIVQKAEGVRASELENQLFVQESYNEIEYAHPDKYKQTVKAFSSSFPDDFNSQDVMRFLDGSLYSPRFYGLISPVNKKAFSYYNFRYEGFIEEDGKTVNKIKIIPKFKDPELLRGYIYIADDTWHIHSADITCNIYMVREDFTATYQEMAPDVYLPITFSVGTVIDVLGTYAKYDYHSSVKYNNIISDKSFALETEKEKIGKREFEIKKDDRYIVESDTLATKRDSSYWSKIRAIPIDVAEIVSYARKDSIQHRLDSLRKDYHSSKFSFSSLLTGGHIGGDSTRFTFKYDGLLQAAPEYNFVDGVWLGQKFELTAKLNKYNKLKVTPYLYYAQARKSLIAGGEMELAYAPKSQGQLKMSGGSTTTDYNPHGIYRLNNAFASLIRGRNYNYYYDKEFVNIENKIDLANGLTLGAEFEMAWRTGLSNHTDYTWGSKSKISENPFPGERFDRTSYAVRLWYAPYAYYSLRGGRKHYTKITSPIFYIGYQEAFSSWQSNNSRFRKLEGGVWQTLNTGYFSFMDYTVSGGGFIGGNKNMHFADYQHFNTSNIFSSLKSLFESYMLLDNYEASTNMYWVGASANYTDKYILIKRLPFLQGKLFTESLHLRSLFTSKMRPYSEVGYSLNFTKLLNIGIFASFERIKYRDFGVRLSFDLGRVKQVAD